MSHPLHNIAFPAVIEGLYGHKVLPFDKNDAKNQQLIHALSTVAEQAGRAMTKQGIARPRANEVGNDAEEFVKHALLNIGLTADTPTTQSGKHKGTGYPDLEVRTLSGETFYLEVKTFSEKNADSSLRSFYLSPSDDPKVVRTAFHLLLAFWMEYDAEKEVFYCHGWKLLSLENVPCNVKYEFNASNHILYKKEDAILAQSLFSKTDLSQT